METMKTFDVYEKGSEKDSYIMMFRFSIQVHEGQGSVFIKEYHCPGREPDPKTIYEGQRGLHLKAEILPDMISALQEILSRISRKESDETKKCERIFIYDAGAYGSAQVRPFTVMFQRVRPGGLPSVKKSTVRIKR